MLIWDTIVEKLVGKLPESIVEYYKTKRELEHDLELEVLRGKFKYEEMKTQRAAESEGRDADWELESIRNSGWKDEWVLLLLSIPLVLVFIPATQDSVMQGFATLEQTPEWYRWLTMIIFTATYGIRIWRRKLI
jgi:hypothetical protein